MAKGIFDRGEQLRPSTLAAVAERRFGDAEALCATKNNARANGAAYLAGFVIEILLKARMLERYPAITFKSSNVLDEKETKIWRLIWREHDLTALLDQLPKLQAAIKKSGERAGRNYLGELKAICSTWTIQARYSSRSTTLQYAQEMIERIRSLKELLK